MSQAEEDQIDSQVSEAMQEGDASRGEQSPAPENTTKNNQEVQK